jgi:hypothetical protein
MRWSLEREREVLWVGILQIVDGRIWVRSVIQSVNWSLLNEQKRDVLNIYVAYLKECVQMWLLPFLLSPLHPPTRLLDRR